SGLVVLFRNPFRKRLDSVLYIRAAANQTRKKTSSSFFYHLVAVRDASLMPGFACAHAARHPLFDSDSPTPVVAFLSVTSKVAASALATRILDIQMLVMQA
ncbi:hypothetical protein, partial [Empedobacter falsenii]|uniref:hypothetical protein n=1 Tax=Empedobacter falsenii TaxID=343874 RepID=UPI000570A362